VVALGLGAATLTAVAGNQRWATVDGSGSGSSPTYTPVLTIGADGKMPLALALSLVLLAVWGVLLVTRGVVRHALAGLAVAAALGMMATVVAGHRTVPASIRDELQAAGVTGVEVDLTSWYWVAAVGAAISLVATVLAVRHVRAWPEMGSRYDAPGAGAPDQPESDLDLWKALDEGRDPTE